MIVQSVPKYCINGRRGKVSKKSDLLHPGDRKLANKFVEVSWLLLL